MNRLSDTGWLYKAWQLQQELHWSPSELAITRAALNADMQRCSQDEQKTLVAAFQCSLLLNQLVIRLYLTAASAHPQLAPLLIGFANMLAVHQQCFYLICETLEVASNEKAITMENKAAEEMLAFYPNGNGDRNTLEGNLAAACLLMLGVYNLVLTAIWGKIYRDNELESLGGAPYWMVRDMAQQGMTVRLMVQSFLQEASAAESQQLKDHLQQLAQDIMPWVKQCGAAIAPASDRANVENYGYFLLNRRFEQLGFAAPFPAQIDPFEWLPLASLEEEALEKLQFTKPVMAPNLYTQKIDYYEGEAQ